MRVHENLTKLHNFTVNNRMKTTKEPLSYSVVGGQMKQRESGQGHPGSTTNQARRSQERTHGFGNMADHQQNLKSSKKRERSAKRKSHDRHFIANQQQTFGVRGMSHERDSDLLSNSVPDIDR